MASKSKSNQPTDIDQNPSKKIRMEEVMNEPSDDGDGHQQLSYVDISLDILFNGFRATPVHEATLKLQDLPDFLVKHGAQIKTLNYAEDAGERNRQLIIKHCPNIRKVKFEFTEYPDQVDDDESQRLITFLTALAPRLTSLETINNLIGLHYLSCMSYVYENFSDKIKFVKTDELQEDELSVLSGDNNKNNPALSLEELIYCDSDFLYSEKRNSRSPESLALSPASLTDLVKLTNLRRIDLPFFLSKQKIPPVTAPLPLLDYASIRLISRNKGKLAPTTFTENIGIALANICELKLYGLDRGLMVLTSLLTNCQKMKTLDLTDFHVRDDPTMNLAKLAEIEPKLKQLDARIQSSYSHETDVILHLLVNAPNLATINVDGIIDGECLCKFIAAGISLSEKVQHKVEFNLKWSHYTREENKFHHGLPTYVPDNLTVSLKS